MADLKDLIEQLQGVSESEVQPRRIASGEVLKRTEMAFKKSNVKSEFNRVWQGYV